MPVVDSALLARVVDGVLVVVSANKTPRKLLEEALNELDPAKVVGIVFNNDDRPLYGYDTNYRRYFSRKLTSPAEAGHYRLQSGESHVLEVDILLRGVPSRRVHRHLGVQQFVESGRPVRHAAHSNNNTPPSGSFDGQDRKRDA